MGSKVIKAVKGFFIFVTIMIFFGFMTATVYYLISDTSILDNVDTVITFLVELLGGSAIAVALSKQLKKHLNENDSVSEAITAFLSNEPIVIGLLWIFIVVQSITFTYILPIHSIVVEVKNLPSRAFTSDMEVSIMPNDVRLSRSGSSDNSLVFESRHAFRWGDSLRVRIRSDEFEYYEAGVAWPGLAIFTIFSGNYIPVDRLTLQTFDVRIITNPSIASIEIHTEKNDTTFTGSGYLKVRQNQLLNINVSAENYFTESLSIPVTSDTLLEIALEEEPAQLLLKAYSEGGIPQDGFIIIVDGLETNYKTGEFFDLTPGTHSISLKKERNDSYVVVPEFHVTLQAGEVVTKDDLIVQIIGKDSHE